VKEKEYTLSSISIEVLMHKTNDIWTNGSSENSREWDMLVKNLVGVVNREN